ncbi:MAG TPA: hypothetical protein VFV98_05870 [Vicinamibacterales bacterium]|nr:hypothetical protein [Vicinamibacterales bacterium]
MRTSKAIVGASIGVLWLLGVSTPATAQPSRTFQSAVTIGVSSGLWDHVPTSSDSVHHPGLGADATIEGRLTPARRDDALRLRLQIGRGSGDGAGEPGFDYTRWILSVVRPIVGASSRAFTVYGAGGAGRYETASARQSSGQLSLSGAIGFDAAIGRSPLSINAELQLHSIGQQLFGTTSVGLRVHLR